ncbi:hypothetical protein LCGC14_2480460 [marine sediment metagenome]|uniref:Uncharacterized protein n=1 Tax=marine sediment metagenome TaxID=412755 RepID=A0A0F9DJT6_9ZZZZ
MTTSAKLQELRELARPVAACTCPPKLNHATGCQDTVLIAALARLVVTLTEVAKDAYHFLPEHPHAAGHACADVCAARDRAETALAAVEELGL